MVNSNPQLQHTPVAVRPKLRVAPILKEVGKQTALFVAFAAIGRASLPDGLAPFGAAACAAAFIAGLPFATIAGVLAGAASRMQWTSIVAMCCFLAGAWTMKQLFHKSFRRMSLLALFVGEVLAWLIAPHASAYEGIMAGLSGVAALLLTQLYYGAFRLLQSLRVRKLLSEEEIIALCMLAGSVLLGFVDVAILGILPACCVAVAVVAALASVGGAGPGAAGGLALGAMIAVGGHAEYMTLLGLMGVTAGGMHHMGKVGAAAGGMLAATVLVFYGRSSQWILVNCAIGTLIFMLAPSKLGQELGRFVNASLRRESNRKEYLDRLRQMTQIQLGEFQDAFKKMGEVFSKPIDLADPVLWDIESLKGICTGCVAERRCWSDIDKLSDELATILSGGELPFRLQRCQRLESLCLAGQALLKAAARENAYRAKAENSAMLAGRQLSGISDVMAKMTDKLKREVSYDDLLESRLLRSLDLGGIAAKDVVAQWAGGRLAVRIEGKSCTGQCESKMRDIVTQTCGRSMRLSGKECGDVCRASFEQSRNFELKVGVAQRAKDGGPITGDTVLTAGLSDARHLLAISDGMGSGERARKESSATIALLHKLYAAGIDRPSVMEAVNRLLLLRSSDEMYSTVDSCCVDLITGRAEMCKLGAPVSFWINQDGVHCLQGESLPVGILERAEPDIFQMQLCEGDWLILMSDGVVDTLGEDAAPFMASMTGTTPELFARRLLDMAQTHSAMVDAPDDMSVVVAKVEGGLLL